VVGGHTGHVAVDHYHRYRDDVALMRRMGLNSYRFSVSWSRVQPAGAGPANPAGWTSTAASSTSCSTNGIQPWLTLYHWDLPQPIEDAGGWPARDTAARFAEYAALVHHALGDRVNAFTTLNEPWCSAFLGYASGEHAPGRRDVVSAVRAAHHLLLGHGLAVDAIRAQRADTQVGITLNLYATSSDSSRPEDLEAVRRIDGLGNRFFLDPVLCGSYPADVVEDLAPLMDFSHVQDGDLDVISRPLSMLGINYYSRHTLGAPSVSESGVIDWRGPDPVGPQRGQRGGAVHLPRRAGDRDGLGDRRPGPVRGAAARRPGVPAGAAVRDGERGRLRGPRQRGRFGERRPAARVLRCPPARLS
jgi:beta-glucosidase